MNFELRTLIVGGYGIFGGRLVELLENDARLTLLIAGRSLVSARKYCAGRPKAAASLLPTLFDRTCDDVVEDQRLNYIVRRWALFGISMPLFLGPRSKAMESVTDGRFCFDVSISHPLTGLIVRYRGLLAAVG